MATKKTTGKKRAPGRPKNPCPARRNRSELAHAIGLSRRFHGLRPRRRKRLSVHWPKALTSLGRCARLDYLSAKYDGRLRAYFHEFDEPPDLFVAPGRQPGGRTMLIMIGKFQIKKAGIIG